eukprot:TRINITY_DN1208_c0_g1_i6.p1 TRINITY_DN1208_c0_g1~~TRINITY_DN1208_c0_g1_i6.p1  ORF type:complete len:254 (-),score=39.07 TRINITY_DN1208_c0_g1_i6:698-1459(-)
MEVRIDIDSYFEEKWQTIMMSTFTMVATFEGKSAPVNQIIPDTPQDEKLYEIGYQNSLNRKLRKKSNLSLEPPTPTERLVIHKLFTDQKDTKVDTSQYIAMADTKMQSIDIVNPQERNTNNRVFGGYLMRCAMKLAWAAAHMYCGSQPFFLALDEVVFHKPVNIGDVLSFNSEIIYQENHAFVIKVTCNVLHYRESPTTTNTFYFTYTCPEAQLRPIMPQTYSQAMKYLEGQRAIKSGKTISESLESRLLKYY